MYTESLQYALWALAVVGQIIASALIFIRGLNRPFRAFFSYNIFQVLRSACLYLVLLLFNHHKIAYRAYFSFYWVTDAVSVALCLLLVHKIFRNLFHEYRLAHKIAAFALAIATIALLCTNLILVGHVPGHESHRLISAILLLDRSIAIVQVGLVLSLFVCSQLMALLWRTDLSFGIGLGLGFLGVVDVVAASARVQNGRVFNDMYAIIKTFSYLLAVVIWLVYIVAPRTKTDISERLTCESPDVDNWNEALKELVRE